MWKRVVDVTLELMSQSKIYPTLLLDLEKSTGQKMRLKSSYMGTPHKYYGLKSQELGIILKKQLPEIGKLSYEEWLQLLDELYKSPIFEMKMFAGSILRRSKKQRSDLDLEKLSQWLDSLIGWAEVDVTCQTTFEADELLSRWAEWKPFLQKLNKDKNVSKRRASLVLMIKSLRSSEDKKLEQLALQNVQSLMHEKDILITKAVSWILREMIKKHRSAVEDFLSKHSKELPAIALRETRRKLETGRK